MSTPRLRVSRDDLVSTLERQILSGTVAPGATLPSERQLAERFGVSRTGVREALRALAERGLVKIEVGRGVFVRESDPTAAAAMVAISMRGRQVTARHVIEGRQFLEPEAARLAAANRSERDLEEIRLAVDALNPEDSLLDQVKADLRFHLAVARASQNPVLEAMFGAISGLAAEVMLRSLSDRKVAAEWIPQHRRILGALEKGDPAGAAKHMRNHLNLALAHFGDDLDQNLDTVAESRMREAVGSQRSLDELFEMAMSLDAR